MNSLPNRSDSLILFDGVCALCDRAVDFVIRHDRDGLFRLAAIQSDAGARIADERGLAMASPESVYLIQGNSIYRKSTAALRIVKGLGGFWSLFYVLILVPRLIRDPIYDFVARNRYRWFGRKMSCHMLEGASADRFLH